MMMLDVVHQVEDDKTIGSNNYRVRYEGKKRYNSE
jgi:hypothetical protein